jgi:hypothetical protein
MTTYDLTQPSESRIGGIAGFAIRIRRAFGAWRQRRTQPLDREQLQLLHATQGEARAAIAQRGDAHHGLYQLLR